MSIIITLLFTFAIVLSAKAMEKDMMPGMPGFPDSPNFGDFDDDHHHSNFKIADLDGDDVPEIVILEGETLIIMDNQGNIFSIKTVEGIEDHHDDHHFYGENQRKNSLKT
jgi:hypothetical protein